MGKPALAVPYQVQTFRAGILRPVAAKCPLARYACVENRSHIVALPQAGKPGEVLAYQSFLDVDLLVRLWLPDNHHIGLNEVVTSQGCRKFGVSLGGSIKGRKVCVLVELCNSKPPARQALADCPFTGPEVF